jgi:hypothetical protein
MEYRSKQQPCEEMLGEAIGWKSCLRMIDSKVKEQSSISKHKTNPNISFRECCSMTRGRRCGTELASGFNI